MKLRWSIRQAKLSFAEFLHDSSCALFRSEGVSPPSMPMQGRKIFLKKGEVTLSNMKLPEALRAINLLRGGSNHD